MSFEKEISLFIEAFLDGQGQDSAIEQNSELISSLVEKLRTETTLQEFSETNEDLFFSLVGAGALPTLVRAICESYHNYYELIDQQADLVTYIRKTHIIDIDKLNYSVPSYKQVNAHISDLKNNESSVLQQLYAERCKYKSREQWVEADQLSFLAAFEMNLIAKIEAKYTRHH